MRGKNSPGGGHDRQGTGQSRVKERRGISLHGGGRWRRKLNRVREHMVREGNGSGPSRKQAKLQRELSEEVWAKHADLCLDSQHSGTATSSRPAWTTQEVPGQLERDS